jgi:hypothetical protein
MQPACVARFPKQSVLDIFVDTSFLFEAESPSPSRYGNRHSSEAQRTAASTRLF